MNTKELAQASGKSAAHIRRLASRVPGSKQTFSGWTFPLSAIMWVKSQPKPGPKKGTTCVVRAVKRALNFYREEYGSIGDVILLQEAFCPDKKNNNTLWKCNAVRCWKNNIDFGAMFWDFEEYFLDKPKPKYFNKWPWHIATDDHFEASDTVHITKLTVDGIIKRITCK